MVGGEIVSWDEPSRLIFEFRVAMGEVAYPGFREQPAFLFRSRMFRGPIPDVGCARATVLGPLGTARERGRPGAGGRIMQGTPAMSRSIRARAWALLFLLFLVPMIGPSVASAAAIKAAGGGSAAAPPTTVDRGTLDVLRGGINVAWLLAAGGLGLLVTAGFTLAETGLVRSKNASHTTAMTLGMFAVAVLGFWACGFAWMFGGHGAFPSLDGGVGTAGRG